MKSLLKELENLKDEKAPKASRGSGSATSRPTAAGQPVAF